MATPKGFDRALSIVQKFFPYVTSVKDAKDPITIEVTKDDAKSKGRRDHKHCAFAVACQRTMKASGVIVAVKTAYLIFKDQAFRYKLPESISREIVSFDRDATFAPGIYKMRAPGQFEVLGTDRRTGYKKEKGNGKKKLKLRHTTTGIRTTLGSGVSPEELIPSAAREVKSGLR
jgi:hypothetical protein